MVNTLNRKPTRVAPVRARRQHLFALRGQRPFGALLHHQTQRDEFVADRVGGELGAAVRQAFERRTLRLAEDEEFLFFGHAVCRRPVIGPQSDLMRCLASPFSAHGVDGFEKCLFACRAVFARVARKLGIAKRRTTRSQIGGKTGKINSRTGPVGRQFRL